MIRAYVARRDKELNVCPDEPDFDKLYPLLGDREAQDAIREETPDTKHCQLLVISSHACDGCPKNPKRQQAGSAVTETSRQLMAWAEELAHYVQLGIVDAGKLSTAECTAVRIAAEYEKGAKAELQAKLIAHEVSKMFGSSKKGN